MFGERKVVSQAISLDGSGVITVDLKGRADERSDGSHSEQIFPWPSSGGLYRVSNDMISM